MAEKPVKEAKNAVHQTAILTETIKKELKHSKLHQEFMINPFNKMYVISGKPNSLHDALIDGGEEDAVMKEVIKQSRRPPTEKNTTPLTEAQEIGWISTPLMDLNRSDIRLYHPRVKTEITKVKDAEWRQKEASDD